MLRFRPAGCRLQNEVTGLRTPGPPTLREIPLDKGREGLERTISFQESLLAAQSEASIEASSLFRQTARSFLTTGASWRFGKSRSTLWKPDRIIRSCNPCCLSWQIQPSSWLILRQTFRNSDIIARLGGDEFAILAQNVSASEIGNITAHLEENLRTHNQQRNCDYQLALSVGVIVIDSNTDLSLEQLIARADEIMYEQKRSKDKLFMDVEAHAAIEPQQSFSRSLST